MQKIVIKPKKHAKHLIHAQSFKINSKKVVWYSAVKIVNTVMPWISKITIILDKMLQVFMRTSQLTFSRPSLATELSKRVFLDFAHASCTDFHVPTSTLPSSFSDRKVHICLKVDNLWNDMTQFVFIFSKWIKCEGWKKWDMKKYFLFCVTFLTVQVK